MSRFDRMTTQDWAIRDAINDVLQENNRPTSDYTYSVVPDKTPAIFVEQPSAQETRTADPIKVSQTVAPYVDYFALLNPGETPASALESKLSQMQSVPDLSTEPVSNGKWWAGDTPTYAESVAQLYRMQSSMTPEQFDAYAARLDAAKNDPASGFYHNPYTGITSPYVDAISKLGIDVSGGINDEWIAKNQYLLAGARYTDAGNTPAAPTKTSTAAQNAAYYYYQIQRNYNDTKEVLNEEAALKDEIAYWVSRDDLNLSDDQILERLDWKGKYKYLQGLKNAQSDGHVYNYTQPIDYNPDNLRGYIWAARNDGGSGNSELDAVNAALGRGNVWKENKEISDKLDFRSDAYSPYSVKSTLDDAAQYFGVKEFEPGWAEKAAKTKIDWNNPDDVKYWQQVYNAESFTEQAEAEVKEIYDRIDTMIAAGIVDPATIEDGLWDKGLDGSAALTALKKLDASMVRPDKMEGTTRPIDYRKQDVQDYIKQQCAKATEKETLPDFGMRVTDMMGTNTVHGEGQGAAPVDVTATVAPTQTPGVNPTDQPRGTEIAATDRILSTPAASATPAPVKPTPPPVVDQTAKAVNTAQSKVILDSAKTILATGTPDEKMVLSLAPTANAEGVAVDMAGSVQNGTADAGALYDTTAKQAQDFTAAHYMTAKMAIKHYDDLQANLTALQEQQAELQRQHDQVQYQIDRGIVPGIAQTEVQINGETHVFTADYDPTSKEYIIHDSNPTDDAEVERQKADYANTLRYGLNMDETYLEQDNQLLVAAEDLNMQLTAINQQVANAQKMVDGYKMRYDQAQGELKTSESMINAAAMQSVWRANPGMDLSTPEGQQAMAEALQKEGSLAASIDRLFDVGSQYEATTWSDATMYQAMEAQGASKEQVSKLAMEARAENQEKLDQLLNDEQQAKASGNSLTDLQGNVDRKKAKLERDIKAADDYMVQFNPEFDATVSDVKKKLETDIQADKHQYSDLSRRVAMQAMGISPTDSDRSLAANARWESVENMLPDELNTYLWYLDEGGETAAHEYYARLTDPTYGVIPVRITNRSDEALAGFAEEHPVLAYGASILLSPAKAIGGIEAARQIIFEQELNPRSPGLSVISGFGAMQETAKEKMLDSIGAEEGSVARKVFRIGLDGLASGGESLINGLVTGPLAGKISNKILSSVVGVIPMAVSAAGAEAADVKTRGGSDLQAGLTYGLTFATEMLSEAITYENIQDAYKGGVKGIKSAAAKLATNPFVEELLGEEAANVIEYVGDNVIMGDLSNREKAIAKYEETMSHADAVKEADKDFWRDVLRTGLTTLVSTGASQATSYAAGRLSSVGTGNTTQPSAEGQVRANALANGLPLDRATQDMTARTVTMLTSSLNADKGSQVQALSAALFPVSGDAQGQRAAISAGLHMANQFGSEQAVAVAQDVILAAAQEGADMNAVKSAMTVAALGQGEASAVLNRINQNGVKVGDVQALTDAAGRDAQNPAIADRMNAIIHNDRVASRTRDLIGQGALNGVKPYEQAYSQAKAQEAQSQQALETEQECAQTMGENLKTVQGQHAADPANQALAGAMKQATKDMVGQVKVVGEYQQGLENQQQKTRDAEKDLNRVREESMTKVREQAMADVAAEEQAEAEQQIKIDNINKIGKLSNDDNGRWRFDTENYSLSPSNLYPDFYVFHTPNINEYGQVTNELDKLGFGYNGEDNLMEYGIDSTRVKDKYDLITKVQEAYKAGHSKYIENENAIAEEARAAKAAAERFKASSKYFPAPEGLMAIAPAHFADTDDYKVVGILGDKVLLEDDRIVPFNDLDFDKKNQEKANQFMADYAQTRANTKATEEAQAQAQNPNNGTVYTNDQVPVSYHWALVPASDLVTSNTDTGEANSAYPAELQPRDRTRAASQDQVAGMVRNLNPARLGESADAQNGAPIVGPDNVVESGNARTMAIRQAMASNPESAARYTQYVRDNAARFGLNPDDVTDNSVLVRVRDTDLDRVAFARAANESTTATYGPSENAQGDADRLTPRMMELFAPSDTGRLDTTENHAFALAFLNEIIPESERGAYMQDDGSISQAGYDRIRNAVFQRAYGNTALTQALTEDTDGSARNVMNALLKAAPRMMALQDAVDQGGVYDTGLAQKVAEAAQRYMQLRNAGMSVDAYFGQTTMEGAGLQTEDEATQSFMRLFEDYRRSGKKLSEALTNIADAVEDAGDPRAVSFLGQTEAPPLTELIRQGVERMEAARRGFTMDAKTNDVPTLTGKVPESDGTNAQTQNLPERETYTMEMPSAVPPTGNGTTPAAEMPPVNGPQRQFGSQTAQNSDLLHEEVKQYLRENSSYDPDSNNEQLDRAAGWVQEHATEQDPEGYYGAVAEAQGADFNAFSADGQARMLTLMSMAALRGDVATETALADAYNQQGTVLGRALQSRQIFGMMTPLGRQAVLLKETDRINKRYADRGQTTRVALSPDTLDKAGKAKTAEDFQRVQKQAYKELAEQMPPNWKDKLQAWRMLSMLGNPRTHVRNFFGNWLFMPAVKLKNVIGTAIEGVAVKPGSGEMRTKSLTVSKENRDFAKADAIKMKDTLTGESKYNPDQKVEQERKIFGTKDNFLSRTVGKALQWLSDKNSEWLEKEDWAFLHRHYENALGGWMNANKLTPETITPEQLTQAREYAINEAQKATYRDANKIASLLADISRKGGLTGFIVDTALPFKKTPANILKRGIEYSPIGLIRTLAADTKKVKQYTDWVKNGSKGTLPKNAISPTQYIDRISSGLSGTATAALGALLASLGLVTVGYDDDKKTLEELEGKQEYALNVKIGDANVSYTIDWAAPSCMPFFVGASIYNIFQEGINDPGQIADALLEITEPVFNLSMLDGVNSLMETSQWSGGNAFTQIGEKLATNYLSSFIPTFAGQVSRTIDPVRRKSYVESGASLSIWRYALEQAQNKTPFSVSNIPYRNVWGDEDRSPEWLAAIENFISPGYINKITPGKVEKELARLYDETGKAEVIPQAASKSPYIGGQQVKLNAEQYDQYTTVRGTTAKKLLEELIDRPEWALLDGEAKIDIVGQAWTYSNAIAAKDLFPNSKMTAWIQAAQKEGNAAEAIIQRHEEQAKKDYVKGHKESLFNAVDQHNTEAFQTSMFALDEANKKEQEEQGKKPNPAYVHDLLVKQYKPLYIAALNDGDTEAAETIRDNLLSMPMTGIDTKTILGWQYEAQKQKVK